MGDARLPLTYSSEADFVPEIVESTDTILGIFEVVVLDEPKAGR
jgi:hypothetical protein